MHDSSPVFIGPPTQVWRPPGHLKGRGSRSENIKYPSSTSSVSPVTQRVPTSGHGTHAASLLANVALFQVFSRQRIATPDRQ